MRHQYLLAFALLLAGSQAPAQATFEGYYINVSGDTTRVSFPGYKQWSNNPQQITVRTQGGEERVLTPDNTREVTIEGYDTYRSRRFTRLLNPYTPETNYNNLSPSDSLESVKGFLLFLTESKGISLYKYNDRKRENYFLESDTLVELLHKLTFNAYTFQLVRDNRYQQQLQAAFGIGPNSDAGLRRMLDRTEYREDALVAFVEKAGGHTAVKKKKYPGEITLMGGVAYNTFEIATAESSMPGARTAFKNSFSPVVGATLYAHSQRGFGRSFFLAQLKYYQFKNTGTFDYYAGTGTTTYQSSVMNLGLGLGHTFYQARGLAAYAAAVPNVNYLPNVKEEYGYSGQSFKSSIFLYNLSLQAGARLADHLGVWVHYNVLPMKVVNYAMQDPNHRTVQVGMDWKLKRKG